MPDALARKERWLRAETALGRARIEAELYPFRIRKQRIRRNVLQALGAAAIGTFAAGFSVLLTVVILNFVFHYSPA